MVNLLDLYAKPVFDLDYVSSPGEDILPVDDPENKGRIPFSSLKPIGINPYTLPCPSAILEQRTTE